MKFKGEKWICDLLKEEFIQTFPKMTTTNAKEADINGSKEIKKDENQKTPSENIKNNNDIISVEKDNSNNEDDELAPTIN